MADTKTMARAVAHVRKVDPRLAPVIDWAGPCRLVVEQPLPLFLSLGRAIVAQQLSARAATTIFGRVCALYPGGVRGFTPRRVLETPESDLRAAGLSRNKSGSLRDLASRIESRDVPGLAALRRMDDEAVIEALTQVRGIGRWTAEMFLMFRLGRLDVLAVDDLGLRQGHAVIDGSGRESAREHLARDGETWRPYRSVASWYLWRAVEMARAHRQARQAQQ